MFEVQENGATRRLSQRSILKTEPRSYATADEAREGYQRVRAFIESGVDRATTVLGWWERWTNEKDARWGLNGTACDRGEDTFVVYRARTRTFVQRYGDLQVSAITAQHIRDFVSSGGRHSQIPTISTFFKDAISEGLTSHNPAGEEAGLVTLKANRRRLTEKRKRKPPQRPAVEAMLERVQMPCFPRGFYGWLLTGSDTGLRGGELDGMQFRFLQGDVYDVQEQLHYRSDTLEDPKHRSFRKVHLSERVMREIQRSRMQNTLDSPFIWRNSFGDAWRQDARDRWWTWSVDGQPAPRSLVGGATMYQATRHHWAYYALNVLKLSVTDIAALYGHKDGGATLLRYYADPDNDAALDAIRAARIEPQADVISIRRATS